MMFLLTTIIALAGFVSANSFSIGCMSTLMNIGNDPTISGCLAPNLLLPILVGAGTTGDSVVTPVDSWLNAMCAQPACSTNALNALVANVSSGCSAEFGLPQIQSTINMVQQGYTTLRNAVCLKDGSTNCVTQTLTNMQSAFGTMDLSNNNVAALVAGYNKGLSSVLCTNCMKGAYTIISQSLPSFFSSSYTTYATTTCNSSYTDGGIPPGLIQSANNPGGSGGPASPATPAGPSSSSTTISSAPPTSTANANRKSGALGGPSSPALSVNLSVTGLVIALSGMLWL